MPGHPAVPAPGSPRSRRCTGRRRGRRRRARDRLASVDVSPDHGATALGVRVLVERSDARPEARRRRTDGSLRGCSTRSSRRPTTPAGWTSISSHAFWPTSPIQRSPVSRSNEYRHGLRSPNAQIAGLASARPTNGLSDGSGREPRPRAGGRSGASCRAASERLPVAVRIAAAPAVAEPDVEVAIGSEREVAAVVVRVRLLHHEDVSTRGGSARSPPIANPVTWVSPFVSV